LASTNPAIAASSSGRRRTPWVAATSGIAATNDPIA
jgi:hypothetical protein